MRRRSWTPSDINALADAIDEAVRRGPAVRSRVAAGLLVAASHTWESSAPGTSTLTGWPRNRHNKSLGSLTIRGPERTAERHPRRARECP